MIIAADIAQLAYAEVIASTPRTGRRRAAVCLYVACTVPPARSVQAIRNAIGTFATDATQRAALELLGRLTASQRQQQGSPAAVGPATEGQSA